MKLKNRRSNNISVKMRKMHFLILAIVLLPFSAQSQEDNSIQKNDLPLISQVNQGNSYITFPTDIGNIEHQ